jgi:hypothetical protein
VSSHRRRGARERVREPESGADHDPSIDEIYGLEPLFEPGAVTGDINGGEGVQFQRIECPYCGESFETQVDVSSGSSSYVEDCQICCQPIQFMVEVGETGAFSAVTVRRSED